MSTILAAPMANQLQVPFLNMRSIYEIREGPTKFYSWTALITSQLFSDLPWNILGSSLYFLSWSEHCLSSVSYAQVLMQVLDCRFRHLARSIHLLRASLFLYLGISQSHFL